MVGCKGLLDDTRYPQSCGALPGARIEPARDQDRRYTNTLFLESFDNVELIDDATRNAAKHWSEKSRSKHRLLDALRRSAGGSNLLELGFDQDIERAAEVDSISVVPEYSSIRGAIR